MSLGRHRGSGISESSGFRLAKPKHSTFDKSRCFVWLMSICPSSTPTGPIHPAPTQSPAAAAAKLLQSCPTLCDPIDGSPLGSTVSGILQARTLECVAISFSNA